MKNKLTDLNNHLFAQLERLDDEDLNGEDLERELERTKAVTAVSSQIVSNANLVLKAKELQLEYGLQSMPGLLEDNSKEERS